MLTISEMHKSDGCCKKLIEETAGALNYDVVTLMLVVVQRSNVELSVKLAVKRWVCSYENGEVLDDLFPIQYMPTFREQ